MKHQGRNAPWQFPLATPSTYRWQGNREGQVGPVPPTRGWSPPARTPNFIKRAFHLVRDTGNPVGVARLAARAQASAIFFPCSWLARWGG